MKALAILAVCLALATPAKAFVQIGGGHAGGGRALGAGYAHPNAGGFGRGEAGHGESGRGGYGRGDFGLVGLGGFGGGFFPFQTETGADQPTIILAPPAWLPPPPLPVYQATSPAPQRPSGPHIIYIGHAPKIAGPKVIYGTQGQ